MIHVKISGIFIIMVMALLREMCIGAIILLMKDITTLEVRILESDCRIAPSFL
jgi:hypothetical protein